MPSHIFLVFFRCLCPVSSGLAWQANGQHPSPLARFSPCSRGHAACFAKGALASEGGGERGGEGGMDGYGRMAGEFYMIPT